MLDFIVMQMRKVYCEKGYCKTVKKNIAFGDAPPPPIGIADTRFGWAVVHRLPCRSIY